MPSKKFKAEERVRRVSKDGSVRGCDGTVLETRMELENGGLTEEARERGAMITVKWDNGTISILSPEALEAA